MLSLLIRNLVFTVVVPGLGGAYVPAWLLTRDGGPTGHGATPVAWEAVPVIAAGVALYLWCAWNFATVGRGTPGLWDAPRRVVAHGPYRWVRNPIYLAALLVVLGEAALFGSLRLLAYAGVLAACFHLVVTGYEEPALRRRFGPATWRTGTRSRAGSRTARPAKVSDEGVPYAGGGTTGAGKSRV